MTDRTAYGKRYRLDRLRGVDRSPVPAGPIAEHLRRLIARGWSARAIAIGAGCSPTTVRQIATGQPTCKRAVAARLLAVQPAHLTDRRLPRDRMPAVGAVRRVQALLALGHPHRVITAAMGHDSDNLTKPHLKWVHHDVYDAALAAYNALAMVPGTSEVTRKRAAASGYVPPLAWDEDTIDDPAAAPARAVAPSGIDVDVVAVARACAGNPTRLTTLEVTIVARAHRAAGVTLAESARICQVTERTIERHRQFVGPLPADLPTPRTSALGRAA